jgi:hypothetical protein
MPTLMASCFLVVKEVNQAVIGWMSAAFLVFVAHGVKLVRAARSQGLLSALDLCSSIE